MKSEMVRRVADALSERYRPGTASSDVNAFEVYERMARVAIAAMREPTDAMMESGAKAMVGSEEDSFDNWTAMIDEALK